MSFGNLSGWEIMMIVLVGLFIFGPDRLPKAIGDGLRMLRTVRQMARNATGDLSRELGTQVELEDLHPKTFLRKHLLSEEDERALRKPLQDVYDDVRGVTDAVNVELGGKSEATSAVKAPSSGSVAPVRRSFDDVT